MNSSSSLQGWGLAVLRVVVGVVFLMHGGQKLFVYGFHGVTGFLTSVGVPAPAFFAVVLTLVEFLGGAALVSGLVVRWAAFLLAIDMAVAILAVRLKGGFFSPEGMEFELTLFAANLCLLLEGAGAASLQALFRRKH